MTSETRSQGAQAPQQLPRFGYFFLFCVLSLVSASSEPDFGADDASSGDAWIDFAHHDPYQGTFVFPNGFRIHNAARLLQRRVHEGGADVAVLVLVDGKHFQIFAIFPAPRRCAQGLGFDFQCLHFVENSSDLVGHIAAYRLAPGKHSVIVKAINPDCVKQYLVGQEHQWGIVYNGDCEVLGVESESCDLHIASCSDICQPLQPPSSCSHTYGKASFAVIEHHGEILPNVLQREGTLCDGCEATDTLAVWRFKRELVRRAQPPPHTQTYTPTTSVCCSM